MFKFLDSSLATHYLDIETVYPVPGPGEKWGPWLEHSEPGECDGKDCGPGGYHLMKHLDASYAPDNWYPWWAQGEIVLGESLEKVRVVRCRLRRISPKVFHRMLRLGWGTSRCLSGADLIYANLSGADLIYANLSRANLSRANLSRANLSRANLSRAIRLEG